MSAAISKRPYDNQDSIGRYIDRVKKIPVLSGEEEYLLAKKWRETGDHEAIDQLLASHLRLVTKIATGYRG
ncbi:sigma-70 factor domain-containing protein, partial [Acinetobacter baumannii]